MAEDKVTEMECGCSGIRNCLICETTPGSAKSINQIDRDALEDLYSNLPDIYHFCLSSNEISLGEWKDCSCSSKQIEYMEGGEIVKNGKQEVTSKLERQHIANNSRFINQVGDNIQFMSSEGNLTGSPLLLGVEDIVLMENFVNEREETYLRTEIYKLPWKSSQSGRRKQDFGPQANFKRRKLKIGNFTGLPSFLKDSVSKMNSTKSLADFSPVEVCHLEYSPTRGSSIDPHIDDTWLWGERLVTINLLSSTVLTLTNDSSNKVIVQVPLPRRSLLVLQGRARNLWKHSIQRRHIVNLRLALTFRELSAEFSSGSQAKYGSDILKIANNFDGRPLYSTQNCK